MIEFGYVTTPSGQIHYRKVAGDGLPLVMLHQTAGSSGMYDTMMAGLAGTRPLYALDTPGFGASFPLPAEPRPLSQYRDWILDALEALGIGRCHLLGHHTGGCIAVEMAAYAPERCASLTVIGPVYLNAEERAAHQADYVDATIAPDEEGTYLRTTWDNFRLLTGMENLLTRHRETIDYLRAWRARAPTYAAVWQSDQPALYARVACPMLIMCAPDDVLWTCYTAMPGVLPAARYVEIRGGNHEPDVDPEGCIAGLQALIADTEGAGARIGMEPGVALPGYHVSR